MEDGHMKTVEEALSFYNTDADRGLTPDQVKTNLAKYGANGECSCFLWYFNLLSVYCIFSCFVGVIVGN